MLDGLLERDEVIGFINRIKQSERYYNKIGNIYSNYDSITSKKEMALYIFYDAIYKYKLLINSDKLLIEYLEQLDRLYKKIDNYDDLRLGVHKIICRLLIVILDIKNIDNKDAKEKIIEYLYKKYIVDGYYIHGLPSYYVENIKKEGFIPEEYNNYYDRFLKVKEIFEKYHVVDVLDKDFLDKQVSFSDDLVMGCFYATHAPMYYSLLLMSNLFIGKKMKDDYYLIRDYDYLANSLKKYMSNNLFSELDQNYILDLVRDEWNLIHNEEEKISLMIVPRLVISDEVISLEEVMEASLEDEDIYESVDRLLSSKHQNMYCNKKINNSDIIFLNFDFDFKIEKIVENKEVDEEYLEKEKMVEQDFLDGYGKATVFLLIGALFVTLGVLISVILLIKGGNI